MQPQRLTAAVLLLACWAVCGAAAAEGEPGLASSEGLVLACFPRLGLRRHACSQRSAAPGRPETSYLYR